MKKKGFAQLNLKPTTIGKIKAIADVQGKFMHKIVEQAINEYAAKHDIKLDEKEEF